MADTVWSQIVVLFDGFFHHSFDGIGRLLTCNDVLAHALLWVWALANSNQECSFPFCLAKILHHNLHSHIQRDYSHNQCDHSHTQRGPSPS